VTSDEIPDPSRLTLTTRLNGEVMQHATTDLLIFTIPVLINYISRFTRLEPGDVIVSGTPGGVGFKRDPQVFMKPGDLVEVEISDIGVLANPIEAEPAE
jgi:2-keto-4-pentenoate hydratase/2-oxohepta-3-ene-1,7-dioic acid hydratase in catechol pathway